MNRRANEGVELNPQKDLLPLMGLDQRELTDHFFLDFLSEKCRCLPEAILSWDLTVYPYEEGCRLGWHDEFVSSPRLDNLTSVLACLTGLAETAASDGLNVVALFDNEEVGSQTKQGADSHVLPDILRRIYHAFGLTDDDFSADLARAFMLSVDSPIPLVMILLRSRRTERARSGGTASEAKAPARPMISFWE